MSIPSNPGGRRQPWKRGEGPNDGGESEKTAEKGGSAGKPHSYGQSAPMEKQPLKGEHAAAPRRIARVEDKGEQDSVEDLAGEPMREEAASDTSSASDDTDDQPEQLEALGDMPLGAEDGSDKNG